MSHSIKLDSASGKYIAMLDGKKVAKGQRHYCERKLAAALGVESLVDYDPDKAAEEVKTSGVYFTVNERFEFIHDFTELLVREKLNSFILTGSGGIGKTTEVINTLKEHGLEEIVPEDIGGDFITIKGHSTAKYLYRTLWENNGGIIIFDDADSAFKDPVAANILKAALDDKPQRIISWGAEFNDGGEMPNRFTFDGRCIFISNKSIAEFPQAIVSRSQKVDLTLTTAEMIERIEFIFNTLEDRDPDQKKEVLDFIKKYADKATDLNIRSAVSILDLRENLGSRWERRALYSLVS